MMNNVPTDKYNVAWFKLAECVARGEKERALGVYRLLAHSLNDVAFALQLQGDILLSFNDLAGAFESYHLAVEGYRKDHRLLHAAAVAEHILTLTPAAEKHTILTLLIDLYSELRMSDKVIAYGQQQCATFLSQGQIHEAIEAMVQLDGLAELDEVIMVRQELIFAMIAHGAVPLDLVLLQLHKMLDGLVATQAGALQQFMAKLESLSPEVYSQAQNYCNRA
jgi:hypothetical protein